MDSTGIRVLIEAAEAADKDGSELWVRPTLAPEVRRVLTLVHADRLVLGDSS